MSDTNTGTTSTPESNTNTDTLTPQENAYFDSKGETAPAAEKPAEPTTTTEPAADKSADKTVPLPALHEERRWRQALEQRTRELEIENARYQERFAIAARAQEQPAPKPGDDPFNYIEKVVPVELEEVKRKLDAYEQERQYGNVYRQVIQAYSQDAARFKNDTPDFQDAYTFVVQGYITEAQAMGYPDPKAAAEQHEMQLAANALQNGRSPAEAMFQVAKARGWKPAPKDNGAANKLDRIEAGQNANKSLSAAGGASGAEAMTAEALLKLPMEDFEKWCNTHPAQAKRLMGG